MKNKKGIQLGNAAGAVLALILVALLVIVAIFIFSNFSTITLSPGASLTKVNDSSTANVNELGSSFTFANTLISPTCAFTQCVNASDGKVIPASNWTATNCNVAYVGVNPDPYNNTLWKCSYSASYTARTGASNASDSLITNFSGYPALVGLVGTVIFLGLVIGVLILSFAFGRRKA